MRRVSSQLHRGTLEIVTHLELHADQAMVWFSAARQMDVGVVVRHLKPCCSTDLNPICRAQD